MKKITTGALALIGVCFAFSANAGGFLLLDSHTKSNACVQKALKNFHFSDDQMKRLCGVSKHSELGMHLKSCGGHLFTHSSIRGCGVCPAGTFPAGNTHPNATGFACLDKNK